MIQLRPYQEEALQAVLDGEAKGIKRQLIVLPTGAGKTVIFSHLPKIRKDSLPMLVLAHREELLVQAKDKILQSNPELRVEIEQGQNYAERSGVDVVVASVPTLGRSSSNRITSFDPAYFRSIVVDEAHHAAASSYGNVLSYFHPDLLLGVTATPKRGDNVRLTDVFDDVVYYKTIPDLITSGYLSNLVGYRIKTETDISGIGTQNGDYIVSELSEAINSPERNALVLRSYKELCEVDGRKALIFAADIAHAEAILQTFREANVKCAAVFGHTPSDERKSVLAGLSDGRIQVVVNVGVLTEGFDEPSIGAIILARPTRSPLLYTQIVGRGTRLFEGKSNCLIIDVADIVGGKKPQGLPTLMGLPPDFDLNGEDLVETAKKFEALKAKSPSEASRVRSLADIDLAWERIDLFMPPPRSKTVEEFSRLVWAETSDNSFYLNISGQERLHIEQRTLGDYRCSLSRLGTDGTAEGYKTLGDVESIREAFSRCDRWLQSNRSEHLALLESAAIWRADPPSDKQLKILRKYGIPLTEDLTKGQASQIIDKLFAENPKPKRSAAQEYMIRKKKMGGSW